MGYVDDLASSQHGVARIAQKQLEKFWRLYSHLPANELRDALLTFMPALAERYGDVASAAAADWYEDVTRAATGESVRAVLAEVNREAVIQSTRWAVGDIYEGRPIEAWRKLEESLLRHVKNAGRRTVQRSSARDGYSFARVPSGAKTCAFCMMLASRGFVYGSADSAGALDSFHDGCDCRIVHEFAMSPTERADYDERVEQMHDQYMAARNEVEADGIAATDKTITQRLRDMFPNAVTDGAEVPSILRETDAGWPDGVKPLNGRTWRHILKRHGSGGDAHSRFPDDMTDYEIAKILRGVMADPDYTVPHPERPTTTLNYFKTINGQKYLVGTYLDGAGRLTTATCFPVYGDGGIL